jgi:predicted ATPase
VGDLLGEGAAQEQAVVGETPNRAARLQALAEPGTVVIGNSTRRLLGGLFEYRDIGTVSVKGFDDQIRVWQVISASTVDSRFEALRTATTPLVGRDEEIELLMRRWHQARAGEGCVVLISGEPGIGKSRIAQTVLERLGAEPHTRLRYFCSPHHQDSALYPSITQLERAAGFRRDDTAEQRLAKLEAVLSQATSDLSEAVPLLADLLSIPTNDRYPPLDLTPQKRKEKTLHVLLAQVEGLAARQPVLMVFEDIHWSDPTTRESLDLLIDEVPALRVLVIITFRPEFAPPWVGRPQATLLSLNRLPPRQRAKMITSLTGGKTLPREIADQIIDRTDGVPLFIEELTKSVVESGVLTDVGDRYTVEGLLPPLAIPASLNASLLARIDRLSPVKEVAQIAAALGRSFSHELINAVAAMPQQKLEDALMQLARAELIFQRGTPPDAEYTFKHALVQDAIYGTLLRARRQQFHARISATLEGQFPKIVGTQPELLALHCAEAGLVEKAVGYWLKAGQQAFARCAMSEAVAQLHKGLGLLSKIPDGAARQEREIDLQITLGNALGAIKGHSAQEPGEVFARARQLCEQLGRAPNLRILIGQFSSSLVRGELEQAERHAKDTLCLGEARNDAIWKRAGLNAGGAACFYLGKFIDARAYYENALSLWDPMHRASATSPEDPYVSGLTYLFRTLLCLGYVDQGRLRRDEALAEARRLTPHTLAFTLCQAWLGDREIEQVKAAQTMLRSADEVLAITSERGFPLYFGLGHIMRGWCLGAVGQAAEGIPLILKGVAIWRATGANLMTPSYLVTLAEVYGMAARPDEGLDRIAEAAELVETTHERWAEAEMHRVRGTLLLSMHEPAAAEDSFQQALAVAGRQSARFWQLRAALDLTRLWRDQGKRTEARDLLAPIYSWFTEGFDTPVLKEAKALLDTLVP